MDLLDAAERALDQLGEADAYAYSDPASIRQALRLRNKADSVITKLVLGFENSGEWAPDGAKSSVGWIAKECRLPRAEVRNLIQRGKMLEQSPVVAEAFAAGDLGAAQVDVLARIRPTNEEAFKRDQEVLVDLATSLTFARLVTATEYWKQHADPDGAEEAELARANRRDVWVTQSLNGMYLGQITLDPYSGKVYFDELERLEQIEFEADWAEAKERLGREPTMADLRRTGPHRRADAATEMAVRSASTKPGDQRPEPLFTIVIDDRTLSEQIGAHHDRICQIEGGSVVSPGSVLHHMPGAWFERIIFKPKNRIECSEKARFFTGATRRAIEVRDLECSNEYCENPRRRLQIDHIIPYSKGGLTTQDNARVLCAHCNRSRNWRELGPPGD
jgi:hypothetical protein